MYELSYGEMQYAKIQPIIVLRGRHFVRHLGICYPICIKLLQLMSGVITRNSVLKRSLYYLIAELRPIIVFHGRHFVRHLRICNPTHTQTHTTIA